MTVHQHLFSDLHLHTYMLYFSCVKFLGKSRYLSMPYTGFWFEDLKNQTNYLHSSVGFDKKLIKHVFITQSSIKMSVNSLCPVQGSQRMSKQALLLIPGTHAYTLVLWCGNTWRVTFYIRAPWIFEVRYHGRSENNTGKKIEMHSLNSINWLASSSRMNWWKSTLNQILIIPLA